MALCAFFFAAPLSPIHISPSGAIISVDLKVSRNASPSGAVMWKLRGYIVAPLGLKNMMPTFYRYHRSAGAGFRDGFKVLLQNFVLSLTAMVKTPSAAEFACFHLIQQDLSAAPTSKIVNHHSEIVNQIRFGNIHASALNLRASLMPTRIQGFSSSL